MIETARFLACELLPAVRAQVGDAELWLCGPRASADVERLGTLPGVVFRGFVEDLAGLLGSARLLAAPMFSGGGSRIKVLTALAHGLPVVANDLGLQGIAAPPAAAPRAESRDGLLAASVELLKSPDRARAAGEAARAWAEANISAAAVARLQLERCEALVTERHRTDN